MSVSEYFRRGVFADQWDEAGFIYIDNTLTVPTAKLRQMIVRNLTKGTETVVWFGGVETGTLPPAGETGDAYQFELTVRNNGTEPGLIYCVWKSINPIYQERQQADLSPGADVKFTFTGANWTMPDRNWNLAFEVGHVV